MNSRNILNTWELDRFLKAIDVPGNDKPIRQWLDSVARRWILKEFCAVGRVLRVARGSVGTEGRFAIAWRNSADSRGVTSRQGPVPHWLEAALPEGVYWLDLRGPSARQLESQLHAIGFYFHSLKGGSQYLRLDRIAFPDALAAAYRFRALIGERERRGQDNTLLDFEDGFRFALLCSEKDLAREGDRMGHCAGDYGYEIEHGSDIVSLRDRRNRPHVTIEIHGSRQVVQIKGKANSPVALRYRRYVAAFIRQMGLEVTGDRENAGLTFRPLDLANPQGWPAERNLRALIHREIDRKIGLDSDPCLASFYSDVKSGIGSMSDDTWDWFVGLYRDERGRFLRFDCHRAFEIGGRRFAVLRVRFPERLFEVLGEAGGSRALALRRRMIEELEAALFAFCRRDDRGLVLRWTISAPLTLDLRRLRHEHQQRVGRRLAAARREMRPKAFATPAPYTALARWEADRMIFGRLLHETAGAYI